jgi:hypothetical protein
LKKKRSASVCRAIPWTGMEEAAADEDYWAIIQNAFSVTRV